MTATIPQKKPIAPNLVDSYGRPENWLGAVMEAWRSFPGEAIYLDNSKELEFHKKLLLKSFGI